MRPRSTDALGDLVGSEFVYELQLDPEPLYAFKHPLTQEVAYRSQLDEHRAPVHAAVARAIAEHYPDRLDERAALVAQHWESAHEPLEAARWHARAAAWSGTNDPAPALQHWHRVRELADGLPESAETVTLGLTARIFSLQFGWRLGISEQEAEALFEEADRIGSDAGDLHSRAMLLAIYGSVRGLSHGDVHGFATLVRQAFALAEESGDPALAVAVAPTAYALYCTGEHRDGVKICDRAIELADGDPGVGAGITFGCPYALSHGLKGFLLAELGEHEQARRLLEQGRSIARERGTSRDSGSATYGLPGSPASPESPTLRSATPSRRSKSPSESVTRSHALSAGFASAMPSGYREGGGEQSKRSSGPLPSREGAHGGRAGRSPPRADRRVVPGSRRSGAGTRPRRGGASDRPRASAPDR